MQDGDLSYSRYTLREVEEALSGIDRHRYPKNYANLRAAHQLLTGTAPSPLETSHVEAMDKRKLAQNATKYSALVLFLLVTTLAVWLGTFAGFMMLTAANCDPDVICDSPGLPFLGLITATFAAIAYCTYLYRWLCELDKSFRWPI